MRVCANVLETIGQTPLVRLGRLFVDQPFEVFAKCEGVNPGGSAKDRAGVAMIEGGLANGEINLRTTIIESSSGNMGIALALACRYYGLRFICVTDPRTTVQNIQMLRAYGTEVDVVPSVDPVTGEWLQARITRVHELLREIPNSVWIDQFSNPNNVRAHYEGTGREILAALEGDLDYLFCAVSTCGTITGCARYLREVGHPARIVAVDAHGSRIFSDERAKRPIPGLGAAIHPPLLDKSLVDRCEFVTPGECVIGCRRLAEREAILAGGSAGGVIAVIERMSAEIQPGARCVAILADRGERYLDSMFDDDWVRVHCEEALHAGVPADLAATEARCLATAVV